MDILSDVNVVGKLTTKTLTVSSSFYGGFVNKGDFTGKPVVEITNGGSGGEYHYGIEYHSCRESHAGEECHSHQVYFQRTGIYNLGGVYGSQNLSPSENWITIPANCTKFLVKTYSVCAIYNGDELNVEDKHTLIHPLVTAWSDGKTVELDLEICAEIKDDWFYEYLLGKVTSSSTDREMNIVVY